MNGSSEAVRLAEVGEIARGRVESVQLRHRVDEREAEPPSDVRPRAHRQRNMRPDDLAAPPFHDEEVGAEDRAVIAEDVRARRAIEVSPEPRQHLVLALHVVGARRDLPHRRTAQHELVPTHAQQVGQVGGAVREL